jgi:hypothetical protein
VSHDDKYEKARRYNLVNAVFGYVTTGKWDISFTNRYSLDWQFKCFLIKVKGNRGMINSIY